MSIEIIDGGVGRASDLLSHGQNGPWVRILPWLVELYTKLVDFFLLIEDKEF